MPKSSINPYKSPAATVMSWKGKRAAVHGIYEWFVVIHSVMALFSVAWLLPSDRGASSALIAGDSEWLIMIGVPALLLPLLFVVAITVLIYSVKRRNGWLFFVAVAHLVACFVHLDAIIPPIVTNRPAQIQQVGP